MEDYILCCKEFKFLVTFNVIFNAHSRPPESTDSTLTELLYFYKELEHPWSLVLGPPVDTNLLQKPSEDNYFCIWVIFIFVSTVFSSLLVPWISIYDSLTKYNFYLNTFLQNILYSKATSYVIKYFIPLKTFILNKICCNSFDPIHQWKIFTKQDFAKV